MKGFTYVGDFTQVTGKVLRMYRSDTDPHCYRLYEGRKRWNIMDKILAAEKDGLFSSE